MSPESPDVSADCPLLLADLASPSESPISPDPAEWRSCRWKETQPVRLQKFLHIHHLTINHMELFGVKLMRRNRSDAQAQSESVAYGTSYKSMLFNAI